MNLTEDRKIFWRDAGYELARIGFAIFCAVVVGVLLKFIGVSEFSQGSGSMLALCVAYSETKKAA